MSSLPSRPTPPAVIALEAVARARSSQNAPAVPTALPFVRTDSPRVQIVASPNGTVRIVGQTLAGDWVAEHTCKASRFSERHIVAMEREVLREESLTSSGEAKVLPFPVQAG